MANEIIVNFPSPIEDDFTGLLISVDYEKGASNFLYNNSNRRGIYVYLKPFIRDKNGNIGTVIAGDKRINGFKVLIKELNKLNKKQIDICFKKLEQSKIYENWGKYYFDKDYNKIVEEAVSLFK